ncbi:MAG: hypothetical protein ACOYOO_03960 [Saprospiraceae bacterium]
MGKDRAGKQYSRADEYGEQNFLKAHIVGFEAENIRRAMLAIFKFLTLFPNKYFVPHLAGRCPGK